jgi:hypothetical protein
MEMANAGWYRGGGHARAQDNQQQKVIDAQRNSSSRQRQILWPRQSGAIFPSRITGRIIGSPPQSSPAPGTASTAGATPARLSGPARCRLAMRRPSPVDMKMRQLAVRTADTVGRRSAPAQLRRGAYQGCSVLSLTRRGPSPDIRGKEFQRVTEKAGPTPGDLPAARRRPDHTSRCDDCALNAIRVHLGLKAPRPFDTLPAGLKALARSPPRMRASR